MSQVSNLPIIGIKHFAHHPFKEWVAQVIESHFAPSIADRFECTLEVERYSKKSKNIVLQLKDQKYVMEVYYIKPSGIAVYICDLFSDWQRKAIEAQLLRMITDKVITKQIGEDWVDDGQGRVSEIILSGKLQTQGEATPL